MGLLFPQLERTPYSTNPGTPSLKARRDLGDPCATSALCFASVTWNNCLGLFVSTPRTAPASSQGSLRGKPED